MLSLIHTLIFSILVLQRILVLVCAVTALTVPSRHRPLSELLLSPSASLDHSPLSALSLSSVPRSPPFNLVSCPCQGRGLGKHKEGRNVGRSERGKKGGRAFLLSLSLSLSLFFPIGSADLRSSQSLLVVRRTQTAAKVKEAAAFEVRSHLCVTLEL